MKKFKLRFYNWLQLRRWIQRSRAIFFERFQQYISKWCGHLNNALFSNASTFINSSKKNIYFSPHEQLHINKRWSHKRKHLYG